MRLKELNQQLTQAIVGNDAFRVQALLSEDPALFTARDPNGRTPLLLCLYFGHEDLAWLVRERAPGVDLYEAAALGDMEALNHHLAEKPEAVNAAAPDGFRPLGLAAYFGRLEAAKALLDKGAEPNAPAVNLSRVCPIHSAAANRDAEQSLPLCQLLLDRGADPNLKQAGGWTPLHQAAAHGRTEIVKLLLAHGASTDAKSDDKRTPAEMAELKGHAEVLALLSPEEG